MLLYIGVGVGLLHGVDACNLDKTFQLANHAFDRIILNFPHSGKQRVHINRHLIKEFLASAALFVKRPHGQVHLTLKLRYALLITWSTEPRHRVTAARPRPPYSNWGSEEAASEAGLCHVDTLDFDSGAFPGYQHQTTLKDAKHLDVVSDKAANACKVDWPFDLFGSSYTINILFPCG